MSGKQRELHRRLEVSRREHLGRRTFELHNRPGDAARGAVLETAGDPADAAAMAAAQDPDVGLQATA